MVAMQGMLFPPLDDEEPSHDERVTSSSSSKGSNVLPQDLKDRFSNVRSLLRQKVTSEQEEDDSDLKRKQETAALETARAVQEEMARLQNGIAELEALCAAQEQRQAFAASGNVGVEEEEEEDDVESEVDVDEEDDGHNILDANPNHVLHPIHHNDNHNNHHQLPAFPSFVNAVEPDDDSHNVGSDNDNKSVSNRGNNNEEANNNNGGVSVQQVVCDSSI